MNPRPALYALGIRYGLDGTAMQRLFQLAQLDEEPPDFGHRLPLRIGILGSGLAGFGLILWISANWDELGRMGQFALLQSWLLLSCLGAIFFQQARSLFSLSAFLSMGALFAYFGQTYQTGADPWQLFAGWALLGFPLALAARSDVLWTPWALVVLSAIALWEQTYSPAQWWWMKGESQSILLAWFGAGLVMAWLSPPLRFLSGAGLVSLRTAATLTVLLILLNALGGLFADSVGNAYGFGLLALGGAFLLLLHPRLFEIGALSAIVLGLDTLLVAGLARALLEDLIHRAGAGDLIGVFLFLGLAAALILAGSVAGLLRLARHHREALS